MTKRASDVRHVVVEHAGCARVNATRSTERSTSVADTLAALRVDSGTGLANEEVTARRRLSGYNEIAPHKTHPVTAFLVKFWIPSAWMLEVILLLSAVLRKYSDLAVIGALLIVNAVVGFVQERRAATAVEALRRRLQVDAHVLRAAQWQLAPARELVPGDIVRLRPGDIAPADLQLLDGAVKVDRSALTGGSREVAKGIGQAVWFGSIVRAGEVTGVVTRTGAQTCFGWTTQLMQQARPRLHIEAVIAKVVRWLFVIVGTLLGAVSTIALVRGAPLLDVLPLMLVLLMSAVPVALPVMFTVSMALGSRELARRGVLVTRMSAAEDAATMDTLCVDKTGTITMNRLSVADVIALQSATEGDVLRAGALASREANQDPIDLAVLRAAMERRVFEDAAAVVPVSFTPFDVQRRRTEAVVEVAGRRERIMKGAVRTIAALCGMPPAAIEALEAQVARRRRKAIRCWLLPVVPTPELRA